jgi:two-component system chemotaxis response regulator CheB
MSTRPEQGSVRVLLVEDSSRQPSQLMEAVRYDGDLTVVAQVGTALAAIDCVAQSRPDVVVLDLQLSDGQSLHAIEQIMARTPTPILILSERHSPSAVEALVAGALLALPRALQWTPAQGAELRAAVRHISKVQVIRHPRGSLASGSRHDPETHSGRQPVVAIAASTGGPSALAILLSGLAGLRAPVLVVQHLHPDFTTGLVEWMSRISPLPVETAVHHQTARPGRIYIAPGERHLRYLADGRLELAAAPATPHRPSADQLFLSVAEAAESAGIGVLLTGMGEDGAKGLLAIRQRGGRTLAQDEASSAVFGMPKAAERLGAVTGLLPLDKIATAVRRAVRDVTA